MSKMRRIAEILIVHDEWGIYLGSFLGLGFWTRLDAAGSTSAVTFPSLAAARTLIESWRPVGIDRHDPDDFNYVEVMVKESGTATMEECVAAGQKSW